MLDRDRLAKIFALLGSSEAGEILSAARAADALIRNANTSWAEVLNQSPSRALLAENERLWAMAQQLLVENDALRKRADRRLAHRILAGVKQSGQALFALAIAFDGIAFLRPQLAAKHRDRELRAQRVVVHGLVAATIALPVGIVAFMSLQDAAMLNGPSVRSGTMASSGQEASEAAARSSELSAEAERRGSISDQPSSAVIVTPEARPQPPASDAALAPVEDITTQPATLPPAIAAPDQTARTPEAPPPVISSVPAEEQAAPPATSPTTSPPPTQSAPNQRLSAEMAALVNRGDDFLSAGDIVSARLFYERAADGGDRGAALRLGATFDPAFLSRTGVRGIPDDPVQASSWYHRAVDLGNPAAQEHLQNFEQQRAPEPGSPPH